MVRTRCDCGRVSIMEAGSVRDGSRRQCLACNRFSASIRCTSSSVALPDGRTIAGIAKAHGLPLNTVYRRWTRGWPLERLADPLTPQRAAKPGWGGSTDLPERRGAVYGTRSTASVSEAA